MKARNVEEIVSTFIAAVGTNRGLTPYHLNATNLSVYQLITDPMANFEGFLGFQPGFFADTLNHKICNG